MKTNTYTQDGTGLPVVILNLDLSNVRRKLQEPFPEGRGWSEEMTLEAELWYKRYLAMILKHGQDQSLVPNLPIDLFWHQHILDTAAYRRDCLAVFGQFIDHYPYFGLNGDAEERDDAFAETNALYQNEFGTDCTQIRFQEQFGTGIVEFNAAVDGVGCHAIEAPASITTTGAVSGQNCNHSGSGTGCGQGGGRHRHSQAATTGAVSGQNCNHSGSGTGCGQRRRPSKATGGQNRNHSGSGAGCAMACTAGCAADCGNGRHQSKTARAVVMAG